MPRPKTKTVMSFALKMETIERLKEAVESGNVAGGRSAVVEDALSAWLKRFENDPEDWLNARGMAVHREPVSDDL